MRGPSGASDGPGLRPQAGPNPEDWADRGRPPVGGGRESARGPRDFSVLPQGGPAPGPPPMGTGRGGLPRRRTGRGFP